MRENERENKTKHKSCKSPRLFHFFPPKNFFLQDKRQVGGSSAILKGGGKTLTCGSVGKYPAQGLVFGNLGLGWLGCLGLGEGKTISSYTIFSKKRKTHWVYEERIKTTATTTTAWFAVSLSKISKPSFYLLPFFLHTHR